MKYTEALDYLDSFKGLGSVPGLENTGTLALRCNNPQDKLRIIHVAGTNGKGSTIAMLSGILIESGLRVGIYTSPAVVDYRERFRINGRNISGKLFGEYMEIIKNAADSMEKHPTVFEMETVLAFLYFANNDCDVVLLETGMGGLLDSTNIVKTAVMEIFTHIDLDHCEYLGDTLEKITENKAGIIKENTHVVTALQYRKVWDILKRKTEEKNGIYHAVQEEMLKKNSRPPYLVTYRGEDFEIPFLGIYQMDNAATVLEAVHVLNEFGLLEYKNGNTVFIDSRTLRRGLKKSKWPGRFEKLRDNPAFIIDGAHNPDGAVRLKESIDTVFPGRSIIYIVGMFRDKDMDKVIGTVVESAKAVFTVAAPGNPRAENPVALADIVKKYNSMVSSCDSVEEAVSLSLLMAEKKDVVVAFGSLAFLGRIIKMEEWD